MRFLPAASVALLALPSFAFAQSNTEDLEYRESELDRQQDKLEVRGGFEAQWHEYDNIDLRLLDESSDQAILDSDDRSSFAFTGVQLELGYWNFNNVTYAYSKAPLYLTKAEYGLR